MAPSRAARFLAGMLLLALLTFGRSAAAQALRWGGDAEGGAPYVFRDPNDPSKIIGFEVELAAALAKELGQPVTFTQYDYASLLPGLERGDIDFAMNGLEITPDRVAKVLFSRPYFVYRLELVTRKDDAKCATFTGCRDAHATIATLGDTAAERFLDAEKVKTRVYDGQVEPYRDLGLGRVDAVLLDRPIALSYAKTDPRLVFRGAVGPSGHYAIAFRKRDTELAARIDRAIDALVANGALKRIYEAWSLWTEDQASLGPRPSGSASPDPSTRTPDPASPPIDVSHIAETSGNAWTFTRYFPLLCESALVTIGISVASMILAMIIGAIVAIMRVFGGRPLAACAVTYVELFRGVPVLLLLYFLYYGLPSVGIELGAYEAAILGFGLNYAAYEAEVYRAAIASVPEGQWEAAYSLGMSSRLALRRVILPQAARIALPPMTSDFIALFKDTSLVSVIAVVELTKQYQILSKSSLKYLEIGLVTALLYLAISIPLGVLSRRLEARFTKGVRA